MRIHSLAVAAFLAATAPALAAPSAGPGALAPSPTPAPPEAAARPLAPVVAATSSALPSGAPSACVRTDVALVDTVDSAKAQTGDVFRFRTLGPLDVGGHAIAAGTVGVGTVVAGEHARGAGQPGALALDTRSIAADDGTRLPVSLPPRAASTARGGTGDAPGLLGFVPFLGIGTSIFNGFHHGKEAAILAGTRLAVDVGTDDPARDCG